MTMTAIIASVEQSAGNLTKLKSVLSFPNEVLKETVGRSGVSEGILSQEPKAFARIQPPSIPEQKQPIRQGSRWRPFPYPQQDTNLRMNEEPLPTIPRPTLEQLAYRLAFLLGYHNPTPFTMKCIRMALDKAYENGLADQI